MDGSIEKNSRYSGKMENGPMSVTNAKDLRSFDEQAVIKVCGIGGGGGNAVDRMIHEGLQQVEFITINTDAQALKKSPAGNRLQIGADITGGLGSGADPEIGRQSAIDDKERISEVLKGANMVFLTAGLGGGTGTGAAPIVAELARESGALTVGIVTMPFHFEGPKRMRNACEGLTALEEYVDTLIVVPNDRVTQFSPENTTIAEAFRKADEVLHNGVQSISELIRLPGNINADFADVRTIMKARGRALIGIGVAERDRTEVGGVEDDVLERNMAESEDRAVVAAKEAIICPLLEQSDITGAMEVLVNIIGGKDMGIHEVDKAVSTVRNAAHPEANVIWGAVVEDEERQELRVTVIAAGFVSQPEETLEEDDSGEEVSLQAASSSEPPAKEAPEMPPFPLEEIPAGGEPTEDPEPEGIPVGTGAGDSVYNPLNQQPEIDTRTPAYMRQRQNQAQNEGAGKRHQDRAQNQEAEDHSNKKLPSFMANRRKKQDRG